MTWILWMGMSWLSAHRNFVPPWTVRRQVWSDSLKANHSGILTDVLLFSDINVSLAHHYRVHKRGLPHIAFRKDYLSCLRVFVSLAAGQSRRDMVSPVQSGPSVDAPGSLRWAAFGVAPENQTCPSLDAASTNPGGISRCRTSDFDCPGTVVSASCCVSQPGCVSPGGLRGDRWCEPRRGSYSGAWCRTIDWSWHGLIIWTAHAWGLYVD